ncbi:MAG TPA: hypothetical protein IAC83_04495 [Euryarchaeota archaeon]|nr:hypothetical protein [Euryarchaeota archaeon]
MNNKILIAGIVAVMLCATIVIAPADAEDTGFDVTDGEGRTFHYDAPAERIVSTGAATTLTIAQAGAVSKIVAVDTYSTYDYTGYEELAAMDAVNLGSFYGETNHDYIVTSLINMVDNGEFSLDDTIILTSYSSNRALYDRLTGIGFTKVLVWTTDSVPDYDAIVQMVSDVSMIASGTVPESVSSMLEKTQTVSDAVSGVTERTKALFVWYTGGEFSVGNSSIMNSMLEVANAENIGYNGSTASHYGDVNTVISLLEQNPGTVIFVNYSYGNAGGTAESFREDVLGGNTDYPVVIMDGLWNNWCPESADGLMTIGQYLYPTLLGEPYEGYIDEYFSGSGDEPSGGDDTPSTDGGVSNADVSEWLFIFAGVVALVGSIAGLAMVGRDKH